MNKLKTIIFSLMLSVVLLGCGSDDKPIDPTIETTTPEISSLATNKAEIMYGGTEEAELTCFAIGGNLKYVWQVDLGDLIPMNSDKSKVKFKASACCVGDKIITCTVSNDKGSVSKTVIVKILENQTVPDIISVQTSKSQLKAGGTESANLVCNALGGNLHYKWEAVCGSFVFATADSSKVQYTAETACVGEQIVKCTVTNKLGTKSKTVKINVNN